MALSVEAAELLEHFQWLTPEQSAAPDEESLQAIAKEIADVLNYLLQLSDVLGIDPVSAGHEKLTEVQQRFDGSSKTGLRGKR